MVEVSHSKLHMVHMVCYLYSFSCSVHFVGSPLPLEEGVTAYVGCLCPQVIVISARKVKDCRSETQTLELPWQMTMLDLTMTWGCGLHALPPRMALRAQTSCMLYWYTS